MASEDESSMKRRIRKMKREIDRKEGAVLKECFKRLRQLHDQQRKRESKTNTTDHQCFMMSTLSEDLLLEIFLRLPNRRSLIRCRTVCKRWFSLLSPPHFILRLNQFRYHRNQPWSLPFEITTTSTTTTRSVLFSVKASNNSKTTTSTTISTSSYLNFLPCSPDHHVVIRASFQDLLLVSVSEDDYYICNPFTKQWLALGPMEEQRLPQDRSSGFALVFEPNRMLGSTRFRVVLIRRCLFRKTHQRTYDFIASVYCSESGNWLDLYTSVPHALQTQYYERVDHRDHGARATHDVVTSNGVLYWLGGFRRFKGIIACDPFCHKEASMKTFKMKGHFINLPVGFSQKRRRPNSKGKVQLGVVRGQLRLLELIKLNQACFGLKVWELVDYGDDIAPSTKTPWLLVHDVKLKGVQNAFVLAFHPNNDNAIFVVRDRKVYLYVIGDGKYEEIGEFPFDEFDENVKRRAARYVNVFTNMQPSWPTPIYA
ncbi:F-box domain containing protein [Trema orientale]|uniref:F-box domain containing protein n=1 Tax=Trema orientale TaxID=63057 RepID=A0A2P5FFE9_TREOI|nr:F-box domain containing protein [Trema orientale]